MVDSAGISNLSAAAVGDPLTTALPNLGSLAATIHALVAQGLTIDEAAEKVAVWVDPSIVPALQTLAKVLTAVEKFLPASEKSGGSAAEHGGE